MINQLAGISKIPKTMNAVRSHMQAHRYPKVPRPFRLSSSTRAHGKAQAISSAAIK